MKAQSRCDRAFRGILVLQIKGRWLLINLLFFLVLITVLWPGISVIADESECPLLGLLHFINKMEKIQERALRFICNDFESHLTELHCV